MVCEYCNGQVEWQGPLSNLTHTKCLDCGATNCQTVEPSDDDGEGELQKAEPVVAADHLRAPRCKGG